MIYHITTRAEWDSAQSQTFYQPQNYQKDGFIHCSDLFQVEEVANRLYARSNELLLLSIDPDLADIPVIYENLEGGEMAYPHLYGALARQAVLAVTAFERDGGQKWQLPPQLRLPPPALFTEIPFGLPGKLFRSPLPGSRMFDPQDEVFGHYLSAGVQTVVVLNPVEEHLRHSGRDVLARYTQAGFEVLHYPTPDFSAPAQGFWDEALRQTVSRLREGRNVAVHCHAGVGRTGIFCACLAQDLLGLPADDAITWLRQYIPFAVDTFYQQQFVRAYQRS